MSTRLKILKEAGIMFSRHGIRSVTMDAIAVQLGMSKRTIYENFKDKDDLLLHSIEAGVDFHKKIVNDIVAKSANVIEAFYSISQQNCEMFEKINPSFFEDLERHHPKINKIVHEQSDLGNQELIRQMIEKGTEEGVFMSDLNIEIVYYMFYTFIKSINHGPITDSKYDREEIFYNTFGILLRGLCTPKGIEIIDEIRSKNNK